MAKNQTYFLPTYSGHVTSGVMKNLNLNRHLFEVVWNSAIYIFLNSVLWAKYR